MDTGYCPLIIALLLAAVFGVVPIDAIGDVPQSSVECEPHHEPARLDCDDGDAGGRAVLSLSCARATSGPCWTRLVGLIVVGLAVAVGS